MSCRELSEDELYTQRYYLEKYLKHENPYFQEYLEKVKEYNEICEEIFTREFFDE